MKYSSAVDKCLTQFWIFCLMFTIIGILWRWMEWEVYGAPNPNNIDTIWGAILAVSLTANVTKGR